MFLSINQQIIYLSLGLSVYLYVCLSVCLSIYLPICTLENLAILRDFFIFQVDNIKNAALLRDFLIFWSWLHQTENTSARPHPFLSWPHQKRSNSARLPSFLNLTTSKLKQFCETSSFFTLDSIKNQRILRDLLQKWNVDCSVDGLVPIGFAMFPFNVSKVLRLPRKSDARSYEVLHLSRKIILANLQIWCSKMQPISGNPGPDLLTSLMNMSFVLRLPRKMHLCRSSSNAPCLPSFLEMLQNPHVLLTFDKVHNPLRLPRTTKSECPKVVRTWCALYILTSTCASCHNGVHFFDISTSKSGPRMVCCVHFDFEMCFAPQRRALFLHRNLQKWSEHNVFCTFWFGNVLRATTACTFSTSQLPKVVRTWCVLYILIWKYASRHNGVHFFKLFHLSSGQMAPHPPL